MQALTGPWPTFVRELQDEVLGESGFEGHLDWGHARGRDYQCLATIALLIDKSKLVKKTYPGHPQLEKWLNTSGEVPAKFRNDVFNTMRIFVDLVKNFKTTFHKPNKLAPVEFVMVGLLVYTHRTKLSMTQLNSAIKEMRVDVRSQYDDIRSNTKVSRCLFEFIDKKVIASNLKSDMHGDKPAASIHHQKQNGARAKRKRSDSESSESETLKAPPRKSVPSKAGPSKHAASSSGNALSLLNELKSDLPLVRCKTYKIQSFVILEQDTIKVCDVIIITFETLSSHQAFCWTTRIGGRNSQKRITASGCPNITAIFAIGIC